MGIVILNIENKKLDISDNLKREIAMWLNNNSLFNCKDEKEIKLLLSSFEKAHELFSETSWIDSNETEFVFGEDGFNALIEVEVYAEQDETTFKSCEIQIDLFRDNEGFYRNRNYYYQSEKEKCTLEVSIGNNFYPCRLENLKDTIESAIKAEVEYIAFDPRETDKYKFTYTNTPQTI